MYVLVCPSCSKQSRVRQARFGVTAGCPRCDHKYKLSAETMFDEREALARSVSIQPANLGLDTSLDDTVARVAASQIRPAKVKPQKSGSRVVAQVPDQPTRKKRMAQKMTQSLPSLPSLPLPKRRRWRSAWLPI